MRLPLTLWLVKLVTGEEACKASRDLAVFFSIPAFGHLKPLVSLAEEMKQRGWDALIISTEEANLRPAGLRFETMHCDGVWRKGMNGLYEHLKEDESFQGSFVWTFQWLKDSLIWDCLYEKGLEIMQREVKKVKKVLMIVDALTYAGFDVAETLNVSHVVVNHAMPVDFFVPPPMLPLSAQADNLPPLLSGRSIRDIGVWRSLAQRALLPLLRFYMSLEIENRFQPLNEKRKKYQLAAMSTLDIHRDRLILVQQVFGVEYPRPISPLMHFVGNLERKEEEDLKLQQDETEWLHGLPHLPVIYVSFGTVFNLKPHQAKVLLAGLNSTQFRVLWSLKSRDSIASAPSNVRITRWVSSQLAVLAHPTVKVFISHCGDNSLYESIKMGTPLLCIPIALDQLDCAMRAFDAGVARVLDKQRFTSEDIQREISHILWAENEFKGNIERAKDLMRLAGGVKRAADLVEHIYTFGTDHLRTQDSRQGWVQIFGWDVFLFNTLLLLALFAACAWIQGLCCARGKR